MKTISRILIWLVLMGLFCGILLPCVNADVFDIGMKTNESECGYYGFSSGVVAVGDADYMDHLHLIFDGNESTGLDHDFGPGHGSMNIYLEFPYAFNVSNITVKPSFNGTTTPYSLTVWHKMHEHHLAGTESAQKKFHVNFTIHSLQLVLYSGSTHFYFNDVIINYTAAPQDLTEVINALNILTSIVSSYQKQLNNFTAQLEMVTNMVNDLNATIDKLNQTQYQILGNITQLWTNYNQINATIFNIINDLDDLNSSTYENLTNLWNNYNQLNDSFINIIENLDNLNLTVYENITTIQNDLTLVQTDIQDLYLTIEGLPTGETNLTDIQIQIDKTVADLNMLNNNLTDLQNSLPSDYNETSLMTRVFQLETENSDLNTELVKLNSDLNAEITKLNGDIANLTSELENIDPTEKERIIEKEPDNSMVFTAVIIGIIGIVIAIIAVALIFTRAKKPPSIPIQEEPVVPPVEEQVDQPQEPSMEQAAEQPVPTINAPEEKIE
jgi:uncharacterized coiled-coil DUF342 family protein